MLLWQLLNHCVLSSFGRLCFATRNHGVRRSEPLTPRLEWQAERRSSFVLPPPVGAGIQSRGVKGARSGNFQARSIRSELSPNDQNRALDQVSLRCGC